MRPFAHYFDETVKKIRVTHVFTVTMRASKRPGDTLLVAAKKVCVAPKAPDTVAPTPT